MPTIKLSPAPSSSQGHQMRTNAEARAGQVIFPQFPEKKSYNLWSPQSGEEPGHLRRLGGETHGQDLMETKDPPRAAPAAAAQAKSCS